MPKAVEGENDNALQSDLSIEHLFGVKGKVALVTGGGSGIGAMIASGLAQNGAKVYVLARKDCSSFTDQLPNGAVSLQADVSLADDVARVVAELERREGRLDVLVNNAGTNYNKQIDEHDYEMFEKVMTINTSAIFLLTQKMLPLLRKGAAQRGPARVINIASTDGLRAPVDRDNFAYGASKAAVIRLSEHLAGALGRDAITVNTVCPGPFQSRMMRATIQAAGGEDVLGQAVALGKIGSPADAAGVVLYLSGAGAAGVTGATVLVDSGALVTGHPSTRPKRKSKL